MKTVALLVFSGSRPVMLMCSVINIYQTQLNLQPMTEDWQMFLHQPICMSDCDFRFGLGFIAYGYLRSRSPVNTGLISRNFMFYVAKIHVPPLMSSG